MVGTRWWVSGFRVIKDAKQEPHRTQLKADSMPEAQELADILNKYEADKVALLEALTELQEQGRQRSDDYVIFGCAAIIRRFRSEGAEVKGGITDGK